MPIQGTHIFTVYSRISLGGDGIDDHRVILGNEILPVTDSDILEGSYSPHWRGRVKTDGFTEYSWLVRQFTSQGAAGDRITFDVFQLANVIELDLSVTEDRVDFLVCFSHRFWVFDEVVHRERQQTRRGLMPYIHCSGTPGQNLSESFAYRQSRTSEATRQVQSASIIRCGRGRHFTLFRIFTSDSVSPVLGSLEYNMTLRRSFFSVGFRLLSAMTVR